MCELLILECEPMVGRILEHKLRREGHTVTWLRAPDGAIAVPDVALVAISLGGDSRDWMAGGDGPRVGWFAICEHDDDEAARRAVRAGAAGVIRKPFKPTQVAAQVRTLLEVGA
jgi:DNA-binding response OmpR family regulator